MGVTEVIESVGFIGCGKMAQAMIAGLVHSNQIHPSRIIGSARTQETLDEVKEAYNIETTFRNTTVAESVDCLILSVHPGGHEDVIQEIRTVIRPETIVITVAAGITMSQVEAYFNKAVKVVRTMPNTPTLVGEGMTAVSVNEQVTEDEKEAVISLLSHLGKVEVIPETQMDAIPAISGSSPAYVYMMIEAMADGGVRDGLSRDQAYRLAAQAVLGAAKMVLESGMHPGELKDKVCSPGGSTIAAVSTLEEEQFRGTILKAMASCTNRIQELKK
ncbi:pyrroline-5-carboxylate reductase [Pullulanibacillus sp. KACC 23026]|uniref:pyrroline-5-carboxylate reductase n=1 Tax=Pullulanibacillus sp. KACC 23026 TaxID=3028315 RepID=UPI0023B1D4C9|nr:pyrroline-5-carboxylate reductase [Pullulanibacillus sp. KACC 23026]WEG13014.1 pyrroline-5-carboxylate reductase [Pullulanibacillus sp. KACC 23026]